MTTPRFSVPTFIIPTGPLAFVCQALPEGYALSLPHHQGMAGLAPQWTKLDTDKPTHLSPRDKPPLDTTFLTAWASFCLSPYPLNDTADFLFSRDPERAWFFPDGVVFSPKDLTNLFSPFSPDKTEHEAFALLTWFEPSAHGRMESHARAQALAKAFSLTLFRPSMRRPIVKSHKGWEILATDPIQPEFS